jgi:oligoendopeptidase F
MAAAKASAAAAWDNPELLAIPQKDMEVFLAHDRITDYRVYLQRILRFKPHILSDKEERIRLFLKKKWSLSCSMTESGIIVFIFKKLSVTNHTF